MMYLSNVSRAPWLCLVLALLGAPACASLSPSVDNSSAPEVTAFISVDSEVVAVPLQGSPCRGPRDALVTVVEFSDFECPHCARSQEILAALESRHPGELRVCFKHRSIPLHFFSRDAAEAAVAARLQGKFWPMHDLLFAQQKALGPDDLASYARRLGLDVNRFNADRMSDAVFAEVDRDEALAADLGIRSAPVFFLNGRKLMGARPLKDFESVFAPARADAVRALKAGASADHTYQAILQAAQRRQKASRGRDVVVGGVPVAAGDPCRGPLDAPVTVIEFTDFECPFCAMAKQTMDALEEQYRGRLRLCIKMNPLPMHAYAADAARLALAAQRQGRFFDLYADLFAHQDQLNVDAILRRAGDLGLDVEQLQQDARSDRVEAMLARHQAQARAAKLKGTPAFVINDEVIFGARPFAYFEDAIERQLQAHKP